MWTLRFILPVTLDEISILLLSVRPALYMTKRLCSSILIIAIDLSGAGFSPGRDGSSSRNSFADIRKPP